MAKIIKNANKSKCFCVVLFLIVGLLGGLLCYNNIKATNIFVPKAIELCGNDYIKQSQEALYSQKIKQILEEVVGQDNIKTEVNLEIDFDTELVSQEFFSPNDVVIRKQTSEPKDFDLKQSIEYAINKTTRNITKASGYVKRISAVVLVNDDCQEEAKNKVVCYQRNLFEMNQLYELVETILAIDYFRGDVLKIENVRFSNSSFGIKDYLPLYIFEGIIIALMIIVIFLMPKKRNPKYVVASEEKISKPEVQNIEQKVSLPIKEHSYKQVMPIKKDLSVWDKISQLETNLLVKYLKKESPQTIALVLSKIHSDKSSLILSYLSDAMMAEVVDAMLNLKSINKEIMQEVEIAIKRDLLEDVNQATVIKEKDFLGSGLVDEDLLIETFEDLSRLSKADIDIILSHVSKQKIALSLKGASQKLRQSFLSSISPQDSHLLTQELQNLGPAKLKDIEQSQKDIVAIAQEIAKLRNQNR